MPRRIADVADLDRARPEPAGRDLVAVFLEALLPDGHGLWVGRLRHQRLILRARLGHLERRRERKDRASVLDRHHSAGGERAAVADAVDGVDDRDIGIAGPDEVGM
jgi:hypothetical protein